MSVGELSLILAGEVQDGWRLVSPLSVTIGPDDDGWFVADTDRYAVHGTGESAREALLDLLGCLIEYYELVEESAKAGDPYDQSELTRLRETLQPTT